MGPGEVEVGRVPVSFRHGYRAKRNVGPAQTHAREVHLLDALPAAEPVQAIFEPVMMPSHNEEQHEAEREGGVAEQGPSQFMRNDRAEKSDGKDCEPPGCKPCAGPAGIRLQLCHAAQHSHQTVFPRGRPS